MNGLWCHTWPIAADVRAAFAWVEQNQTPKENRRA